MVNRVFDPEQTIEVAPDQAFKPARNDPAAPLPKAPRHAPLPTAAATASPAPLTTDGGAAAVPSPAAASGGSPGRREQPLLLLSLLGGVCLVSAVSSVLYLNNWNQVQRNLSQERNLLLVERLRNLGPANSQPPTAVEAPALPQPLAPAPALPQPAAETAEQLPPPPDEPWIEDLERLPGGSRSATSAPAPLRVPLRPSVTSPAPLPQAPRLSRATPPPPTPVALPQLVGVVGAAGRAGSAIFQTGGSSTNVTVGEMIAGTPWRLRSADGDTVVLERPGEVRRLSIGNGY